MHELSCPSCGSASQFDIRDHLLMCPFCSATFRLDLDTGQKEIYGDHYIIPNTADPRQIRDIVIEWLRRMDHRPGNTDREYFVVDLNGVSVPFWIISLEAHTAWKGLVKREARNRLDTSPGSEFLIENGQFRRSYRWAVSARDNLCEIWGMTRLHTPKEDLKVEWDGFPLDSTFSRGRLKEHETVGDRTAYDLREFFEFKFANGLPILGIQVDEEEALRRAKFHVDLYHHKLSKLNVEYLVDYRTELEIAGIQLIHLPFWHARYVYRPRKFLRHFYTPKEKNMVIEGFTQGVLFGELALVHRDKIWINAVVCAACSVLFFLLGSLWHPAFFLVAFFAAIVAFASGYLATVKSGKSDGLEDAEKEATGEKKEEAAAITAPS